MGGAGTWTAAGGLFLLGAFIATAGNWSRGWYVGPTDMVGMVGMVWLG